LPGLIVYPERSRMGGNLYSIHDKRRVFTFAFGLFTFLSTR